jgi:uncharacterized membrane protein YhaH (DUF805 family)
MEWYLKVLNQYTDFQGRARRKEYWMFTLVSSGISVILMIVDYFIGIKIWDTGLLYLLYGLAVFIPTIAVGIRRLMILGKSGWMMLVSIIPIAGFIWLIVLFATDSQKGTNDWGECPKMFQLQLTNFHSFIYLVNKLNERLPTCSPTSELSKSA